MYGFGDHIAHATTVNRTVLKLADFQCAEIGAAGIQAGQQRTAGIELRFEVPLGAEGKIAIRIGEIAHDDAAAERLKEMAVAFELRAERLVLSVAETAVCW